ncbi:MAG: hypothetical protein R6W88_08865 [Desulfobacterales bacterium]
MYESKLERVGKRFFLTCYYDRTARNWDQAITQALERHGLKVGAATIICKPFKKGANENER